MTNQTTHKTLDDLDQELRRHITRLLEITCDDWQASNLLNDAIPARITHGSGLLLTAVESGGGGRVSRRSKVAAHKRALL